jgi:hypothetical protein
MAFLKFLTCLKKEFADADTLEWHDKAKGQILLGIINRTILSSLINYGIPTTFLDLISWLHEISTDMDTLNINKVEQTQRLRS